MLYGGAKIEKQHYKEVTSIKDFYEVSEIGKLKGRFSRSSKSLWLPKVLVDT